MPVTPEWETFILGDHAGTTVVVERDSSEFARLAQLGDILGLSQFDVATVRSRLLATCASYARQHSAAICCIRGVARSLLRHCHAVPQVHQGLAEQSYRHQVQTIMGDGQLTKERAEALAGDLTLHPCCFGPDIRPLGRSHGLPAHEYVKRCCLVRKQRQSPPSTDQSYLDPMQTCARRWG